MSPTKLLQSRQPWDRVLFPIWGKKRHFGGSDPPKVGSKEMVYIVFCIVALFNGIYCNPMPWNEHDNDDWKPNPPVVINPPLVPGGFNIPECVVSIDHGVYFNNCTLRRPFPSVTMVN